eukprot:SAG11_NODE_308_length_10943_cov_6.679609_10_plen_95_part_00
MATHAAAERPGTPPCLCSWLRVGTLRAQNGGLRRKIAEEEAALNRPRSWRVGGCGSGGGARLGSSVVGAMAPPPPLAGAWGATSWMGTRVYGVD